MGFAPLKVPNDGIYLLVGEQRIGPLTLEQVKAKFDAKEITRSTYVWYADLANWITVGDLPTFDRRDATIPPVQKVPSQGTQLWVFDRGKVVAIDEAQLRSQIQADSFRRADLIFVDDRNEWVRADQHPAFGGLFSPNVPALPTAPTPVLMTANAPLEMDVPLRPRRARPEKKKSSYRFALVILIGIAIYFGRGFFGGSSEVSDLGNVGRTVASPSASFSGHHLVFSLGAKADSVRGDSRFSRCLPKPKTKDVYRCDLVHPALDRFEMVFQKQKVFRISAGFVPDAAAVELFKETVTQFGNPTVQSRQPCSALNLAQRTKYSALCTEGIEFMVWKGKDAIARATVAVGHGVSYPLDLALESLPQNSGR